VTVLAEASAHFAVFSRLRPSGHLIPRGRRHRFQAIQLIHPPFGQNPGALRPYAALSDATLARFIAVQSKKKPQALRLSPK